MKVYQNCEIREVKNTRKLKRVPLIVQTTID